MAIIWRDDLPNPEICDYCQDGCQCGSPKGLSASEIFAGSSPSECDFCAYGCNCGAEEWEEPGDGGWDEQPDCECECKCCHCECECRPYVIDADSYNAWVKEACYVCDPVCLDSIKLGAGDKVYCVQEIGNGYKFQIRVMPPKIKVHSLGFLGLPIGPLTTVSATLDIYLELHKIKCSFTGPVMIPMLLGPTKGERSFWMSLTPMEIFSLRPGIKKATGRVLVAGLGMGWMTQKILQKSEVSHVTQVELCPEVVDFFGKPLEARYPGKIDFLIGDVWSWVERLDLDSYDSIIFDIWPEYGSAHMDRRFKQLKKDYRGKVWGWGDY